jgi:hypothetical protein
MAHEVDVDNEVIIMAYIIKGGKNLFIDLE